MRIALAASFLLAACAGRTASPAHPRDGNETEEPPPLLSIAPRDAGAEDASPEEKEAALRALDCDRGIPSACAAVAARAERTKNLPYAVRMHERACELHEASSCVRAARMHLSGLGVPPSRAKQIELLSTACKLGDALACTVPAKALMTGNGVPKDERRAIELWQRACAAGSEPACDAIADAGL